MDQREAVTQVRSSIVRGAHEELVALLDGHSWPAHSLQLIGDGLVDAVRADEAGAAELARDCRRQLDERGWEHVDQRGRTDPR